MNLNSLAPTVPMQTYTKVFKIKEKKKEFLFTKIVCTFVDL